MNVVLNISLSLMILIQSIGISFNDIVQLDEFIEHAQFHSEQHGDNFLDFVSKHYGSLKADHEKLHQDEQEEHEELPFQHHSHISSISTFILNTQKADFSVPDIVEYKDHNFYYQEPSSTLHTDGLIQPPRHS